MLKLDDALRLTRRFINELAVDSDITFTNETNSLLSAQVDSAVKSVASVVPLRFLVSTEAQLDATTTQRLDGRYVMNVAVPELCMRLCMLEHTGLKRPVVDFLANLDQRYSAEWCEVPGIGSGSVNPKAYVWSGRNLAERLEVHSLSKAYADSKAKLTYVPVPTVKKKPVSTTTEGGASAPSRVEGDTTDRVDIWKKGYSMTYKGKLLIYNDTETIATFNNTNVGVNIEYEVIDGDLAENHYINVGVNGNLTIANREGRVVQGAGAFYKMKIMPDVSDVNQAGDLGYTISGPGQEYSIGYSWKDNVYEQYNVTRTNGYISHDNLNEANDRQELHLSLSAYAEQYGQPPKYFNISFEGERVAGSEGTSENVIPVITATPRSIQFERGGGTQYITLTTTNVDDEDITISKSIGSLWLTCTRVAEDENVWAVTATANENTETRSAELTVVYPGLADEVIIPVIQDKSIITRPAELYVTPKMMEFEYGGGSRSLEINTWGVEEVIVDVPNNVDWVEVTEEYGHWTVSVDENTASAERTAILTVNAAPATSQNVIVSQSGKPDSGSGGSGGSGSDDPITDDGTLDDYSRLYYDVSEQLLNAVAYTAGALYLQSVGSMDLATGAMAAAKNALAALGVVQMDAVQS